MPKKVCRRAKPSVIRRLQPAWPFPVAQPQPLTDALQPHKVGTPIVALQRRLVKFVTQRLRPLRTAPKLPCPQRPRVPPLPFCVVDGLPYQGAVLPVVVRVSKFCVDRVRPDTPLPKHAVVKPPLRPHYRLLKLAKQLKPRRKPVCRRLKKRLVRAVGRREP